MHRYDNYHKRTVALLTNYTFQSFGYLRYQPDAYHKGENQITLMNQDPVRMWDSDAVSKAATLFGFVWCTRA